MVEADTALILEGKIVDRVRKALVEIFNRDGDHWILDSMNHSWEQALDRRLKEIRLIDLNKKVLELNQERKTLHKELYGPQYDENGVEI